MNVAVIIARGGSKRIPDKNIKLFHGKPIISYSIKLALASRMFEKVIVTTDSQRIAKVAQEFGAEVPFLRPKHLSDDFATTGDVMEHTTLWLNKNFDSVASVCCIYATAPFIQISDLVKAYEIYNQKKWSYVFAATKFSFPIQRALKKKENGGVEMFEPKHFESRSQDLEESFHDAGQFYVGSPDAWIKKKKLFLTNAEMIFLPSWRVQDIDTPEDWGNAEKMYKLFLSK